jgi:hypothetical protein
MSSPRFGDLEPTPQESLCSISRDLVRCQATCALLPGWTHWAAVHYAQLFMESWPWPPCLPAPYQTLAYTFTYTHKPKRALHQSSSYSFCWNFCWSVPNLIQLAGSWMGGACGRPWQPLGKVSRIKGASGKWEKYWSSPHPRNSSVSGWAWESGFPLCKATEEALAPCASLWTSLHANLLMFKRFGGPEVPPKEIISSVSGYLV